MRRLTHRPTPPPRQPSVPPPPTFLSPPPPPSTSGPPCRPSSAWHDPSPRPSLLPGICTLRPTPLPGRRHGRRRPLHRSASPGDRHRRPRLRPCRRRCGCRRRCRGPHRDRPLHFLRDTLAVHGGRRRASGAPPVAVPSQIVSITSAARRQRGWPLVPCGRGGGPLCP